MSVKAFKDKHISGVPVIKGSQPHFVGEICFSTKSPGEGWVECNGENGTVDTRETRLFGTPNDASLGQRINDRYGNHNHTVETQVGPTYPDAYLGSRPGTSCHEHPGGGLNFYANVTNNMSVTNASAADFTRSRTYYLKMWMYVGG